MKRYTFHAGTIGYTLEEFEFETEHGPDLLQVELTVAYTLEPYDPGYRYNRNGDGCPPSGGGVEDCTVTVKSAVSYDEAGRETVYTETELVRIDVAVNRLIDAGGKLRDAIDAACIEDATDHYDDYRDDAAERQHEARQRESRWIGSVEGVA